MSSVLRRNASMPASVRPMIGDTKTSMVRVDHIGWLVCDGRELSTVEYRALFNVLGYEFGGSGDTFYLPNAQGRVMGLIGAAADHDPDSPWMDGDVSGEEVHTLTIAEIPAHNHDISGGALNDNNGVNPSGNGRTSLDATGITIVGVPDHSHTYLGVQGQDAGTMGGQTSVAENDPRPTETSSLAGGHTHTVTDPTHRHAIASNGGSQPHNNMQPTLFLGNLFIYSGLLTKNITGPDGISPPSSNPSYYPPSSPIRRLY
jgi:microcystin-dependent protein